MNFQVNSAPRENCGQTRILALDLGKRRIGLVLSDPLGITAQGLPTLERTNLREDLAALSKIAGSLKGKVKELAAAERRSSFLCERRLAV